MRKLKSYTAKTHQGPVLQINEDNFEVDVRNQLFMLFDGFGGSGIGDRAVSNTIKSLKTFFTKISIDPDSTLPFYYNSRFLLEGNALINAVKLAHQNLKTSNATLEMNQRAGVSLIAMTLTNGILITVSAGNCLSLLSRQDQLEILTYPDSLKPICDKSHRHFSLYPLNALGLFDDVELQIRELRVEPNDQIYLFSDGVFGHVGLDEIKEIVDQKHEGPNTLDKLFLVANSRGNLDNQTGMILRF